MNIPWTGQLAQGCAQYTMKTTRGQITLIFFGVKEAESFQVIVSYLI